MFHIDCLNLAVKAERAAPSQTDHHTLLKSCIKICRPYVTDMKFSNITVVMLINSKSGSLHWIILCENESVY